MFLIVCPLPFLSAAYPLTMATRRALPTAEGLISVVTARCCHRMYHVAVGTYIILHLSKV